MKYLTYKIINLLDGIIYIGSHKTLNINDDYMGSGVYLKRAQEKYGIENFRKEILEIFDTPEMMFQHEAIIVNKEFVGRKDTYNLKIGGYGGWDHINYIENNPYHSIDHMKMMSLKGKDNRIKQLKWLFKNDKDWVINLTKKIVSTKYKRYGSNAFNKFEGLKHSEETKKKIGETNRIKQKGSNNSQFGTIWVYNLEEKLNKKIKKEEFPEYENLGWLKGRKIKT